MSGAGTSAEGTIGLEIDADGVARAVIDRPQARNAFTFAMYERLAEICAQIDADPSVRVLVLSGAGGKAFAAGTDIAEFRALETPQDVIDYEARIDRVLGALERVRVPTIAMIAGACTGGGAAIAASCDLRIAEAGARIGFPIARTLGNCLSMRNLARLVRLVGEARVKDMVFTARLLDAHEAQRVGFLGEVLPDAAALEAHVAALARTIAGHAPLTLAATKEALARLRASVPHGADEDLVVACYTSADFKEGMEAFLAKRPPRFTGR